MRERGGEGGEEEKIVNNGICEYVMQPRSGQTVEKKKFYALYSLTLDHAPTILLEYFQG